MPQKVGERDSMHISDRTRTITLSRNKLYKYVDPTDSFSDLFVVACLPFLSFLLCSLSTPPFSTHV